MSKPITRIPLKLFGNVGLAANFAQFGSQLAGAPLTTKDISMIQALAAWINGWQNAVASGNTPYLEDLNAVFYVLSYMQVYMLQEGIPEYDIGTDYFTGSIVKRPGEPEFYSSRIDANTGNALPAAGTSNSQWQFLYGLVGGVIRVGGPLAMNGEKITGVAFGTEDGDALVMGQPLSFPAGLSGPLAMNNHKITSLQAGTDPGDAVRLDQITDSLRSSDVSFTGGPVAPDARLVRNALITVNADCLIQGPISPYDGQKIMFRLSQDGTGHTVTFATGSARSFAYGADITGFTASGPRKIDYVGAIYEAVSDRWQIVSVSQGFSNGYVSPGSSISLIGNTHYGIVSDTSLSLGKPAISVSIWFKGTVMTGRQLIGTTSAGTADGGWAVYSDDATGQVEFYITKPSNGGYYQRTTVDTNLYDGSWHNIVCTYDGTAIHIYVDGTERAYAVTGGAGIGSNFTSPVPLSIGDSTGFQGTQHGLYARPAIYFFVISPAQAAAIAAGSNLAGAEAQWMFGEGSGLIAEDASGNGHTMTFNAIDAWSSDIPF